MYYNLSVEEQVGGAENGMPVMMFDPLISNDVGRNGGMDVEVVSRDAEENRLSMGEENIYTSGESLLKLAIIRWDIKGMQDAILMNELEKIAEVVVSEEQPR